MRDTRRQRELFGLAVAAGIIAVITEMLKPSIVKQFKAQRRRVPR
jgi:hypothetical protein